MRHLDHALWHEGITNVLKGIIYLQNLGYRCCKHGVLFLPLVILTTTNSLTTPSLTVSYLYMDVYCKFPRPCSLRCILRYFWWLIQLHIPLISCVSRLHKACYKETNHSTQSKKKWCQNLRKTKICWCLRWKPSYVPVNVVFMSWLLSSTWSHWLGSFVRAHQAPCLLPRCLHVYLP